MRKYLLPTGCVLLAFLANSVAQVEDNAAPSGKTAIFLSQATIAELRSALSIDTGREDELKAEVDKWQKKYEDASSAVQVIQNIDEHDARFHHPSFNRFTPFNVINKRRQVATEQDSVDEAFFRLTIAKRALSVYLESLR